MRHHGWRTPHYTDKYPLDIIIVIGYGMAGGIKKGQYIFGINSGGSYFSYHNAVKVLPLTIEFHF
jgi:hypothetical protein